MKMMMRKNKNFIVFFFQMFNLGILKNNLKKKINNFFYFFNIYFLLKKIDEII